LIRSELNFNPNRFSSDSIFPEENQPLAAATPTSESIRVVRHNQSAFLVELIWRWSFGLGALGLAFLYMQRVLVAISLSGGDEVIAGPHDIMTLAQGVSGVLSEALPLLAPTLLFVIPLICILWTIAATIGRGVTTRMILADFDPEAAARVNIQWRQLWLLHLMRIVALLIIAIGYRLGALSVVPVMGSYENPHYIIAILVFLAIFGVSLVVWGFANWFLSLAVVFLVRDGRPALDATADAIYFVKRQWIPLVVASFWNGLIRTIVNIVITIVGVAAVVAGSVIPSWAVAILVFVTTMIYCVVSDWFLLARHAAYLFVAHVERPDFVPATSAEPAT